MSRRPGCSRLLGPVKQCSVLVRGNLRCAWCTVFLCTREEATIDHIDGDHRNNAAHNLVPSCRGCNSQRYLDWERGDTWTPKAALAADWAFSGYLWVRHGVYLEDAIDRVEMQRWRPLPQSCGSLLARRWHPERMEYVRRRAQHVNLIKGPAKREREAERRAIRNASRGANMGFP